MSEGKVNAEEAKFTGNIYGGKTVIDEDLRKELDSKASVDYVNSVIEELKSDILSAYSQIGELRAEKDNQ